MNKSAAEMNEKSYDKHSKSWHEAMKNNFGHIFLEKPAIFSLLPKSLENKSVLCIGVGSGEELGEILKRKPSKVTAVDISQNLLDIAKQKYPQVITQKMDMNNIKFKKDEFDFVYSSLAFHYTNDWDKLLAGINRITKLNGKLLFSTHNPEYWKKKPTTGKIYTNTRGVKLLEHQDVLPGDVEITFYNFDNKNNIDEALDYSGFRIEKAFFPQMAKADMNYYSSEEKINFNTLSSKNEETPLFYVAKAKKVINKYD